MNTRSKWRGARPLFAAPGAIVTPGRKVACVFKVETIGGCLNRLVEVTADPELLEPIACSRTVVQIELWGLRFRCAVAGFRKDLGVLHLRASSFFRGLAGASEREQQEQTIQKKVIHGE